MFDTKLYYSLCGAGHETDCLAIKHSSPQLAVFKLHIIEVVAVPNTTTRKATDFAEVKFRTFLLSVQDQVMLHTDKFPLTGLPIPQISECLRSILGGMKPGHVYTAFCCTM
jgi:hypothetical protein